MINDQQEGHLLVNESGMEDAFGALNDLECALNQDFKRATWSKDVMQAATNLCAVIDRLRYKIDGGRLQ